MATPHTLWRFPGPLALRDVLAGAPPTLHRDASARVYLGELSLFDIWPGPAEFGALTLLGAASLAPSPGEVAGWWVVDGARPVDPERVLYVPDRGCAAAARGAPSRAVALTLMPPGYDAAVGETRRAIARYADLADRVMHARRDLGDVLPEALRETADTPLHMLRAERRVALAAALEALL
jgi:hypothetical protein